jgi:hypothetical protein
VLFTVKMSTPAKYDLSASLAATELLGPQELPRRLPELQTEDSLGRLESACVDEFVDRGCPKRVLDPGVQVGKCSEDVISGEPSGMEWGMADRTDGHVSHDLPVLLD